MASYQAIARKWRPHRFEDLVGQSHVVQTLKNAIQLGRVSHAYLFSGSRGIGKTSVARIFAKALRCPNAKDSLSSCNECEECRAIAESRSVDVVEIDGASNNGVEAVRGIRENVAYGASHGTYKIYIIDEVHMLSLNAFNALLKTLEEPPPHVIFIFATTEVQKIPLTILSRCQRFEFRRLTNQQVVSRLQYILSTEKLTFSEEALRTIASHSDGSLRDALSLLDQVLSFFGTRFEGKELTNAQVVDALGVSDLNAVRLFLGSVLKKDVQTLLRIIGETYFSGVDLKHFTERAVEELRYLYLLVLAKDSNNPVSADHLDISQAHYQELADLAKQANLIQLERMAQILSKAVEQLSWSTMPRFVLEMAAVRLTRVDQIAQIESLLLNPQTSAKQIPVFETEVPTPKISPSPVQEAPQNWGGPVDQPQAISFNESNPQSSWKVFVDAVMKRRPLLGALLSHANFKLERDSGNEKKIVLAFSPNSFYERQASDAKNRSEIEEQVRQFFGRESKLVLSKELNDTMKSLEETRNTEDALIKKQALEHPEVVKMKKILGAEVVDVDVIRGES
jgi:DNA polymerase III subunit gamma/tau